MTSGIMFDTWYIANICPLLHCRLYESPMKQATPVQKSISASKWAKTVTTEGLDDVRKCLIDKLDDIEAQQGCVFYIFHKYRNNQTKEGSIEGTKKQMKEGM